MTLFSGVILYTFFNYYVAMREARENKAEIIEELESEQKAIHAAMADPFFYKKSREEIAALQKRLAEVEQDIEANYLRWETLENL